MTPIGSDERSLRTESHAWPTRTTRTPRHGLMAAMLLAGSVGCAGGGDAADPLAASGLDSFTVSERPLLVLEDDGTPEKLFTRVAARRTPAGEIVVADLGTSDIRLFGRDGRPLGMLARRGKGPGELEGDVAVTSRGDTIFTFGRPPMSPPDVNVFVAGQGFLSRFRPSGGDAGMVMALDRLSTGQLVLKKGIAGTAIWDVPKLGKLVPDTIVLGLLPAAGGEPFDSVTWLPPVIQGYLYPYPWRGSRVQVGLHPYLLGPTVTYVVSGDRLWLVDGATGQLRAFDGVGREVATARISLEPKPFDPALLERRRIHELASATRERDSARVQGMYEPALRPATAPLLSAAHAGADGELWLRLFDFDDAAPPRYLIVDRDGKEFARTTLPTGLDVHQIGRDFVLGVSRDSLGVESVLEYALRRE